MKELNKNCGIYLIISPSNGRYIGSSKNIKKRWNRYQNMSCNNQYALVSSFRKYGVHNHKFKIIFHCHAEELLFWERAFADIYLALADFHNGLNIRIPGYNEPSRSLSEIGRQSVINGCKKRWDNPQERIKTSIRSKLAYSNPELRERKRQASLKQWTPEARKRKSEEREKYYEDNPHLKAEYSIKIKEIRKNNPEMVAKCKKALDDFYLNNPNARSELKKKSIAMHGHPRSKKIINTESGEIFDNCSLLANKLGYSKEGLRRKLAGIDKNTTPYKYL